MLFKAGFTLAIFSMQAKLLQSLAIISHQLHWQSSILCLPLNIHRKWKYPSIKEKQKIARGTINDLYLIQISIELSMEAISIPNHLWVNRKKNIFFK